MVKRYEQFDEGGGIEECAEGSYVEYCDYEKLESENTRLAAEVERLRKALIQAGHNAGGGLSDEVSTDFICAGVPEEVRLVVERLKLFRGCKFIGPPPSGAGNWVEWTEGKDRIGSVVCSLSTWERHVALLDAAPEDEVTL